MLTTKSACPTPPVRPPNTAVIPATSSPPAAELEALKESHAADLAKLQVELEEKASDATSREVGAASPNIRAEATSGGDPI